MIISQQRARFSVLIALALVVALSLGIGGAWSVNSASAQLPETPGVNFQVDAPNQRLEMIVNSSRIFTLDSKIPKAQVNNPDLLKLTPLSPSKIQVSATKPGVTQVNLWTEDGSIHTVDVVIIGDGRELQMLLESEFPNSTIKVRPLASSVVLSGFVDRPESVSRIVAMAEDYYPRVINNINVGGVQQVSLKVKVYEVSRTKLETLGFDFAAFNGNDFITSSVSGIIQGVALSSGEIPGSGAGTMTFGVLGNNSGFFGFVEALQQSNLAKLLSEPTLTSISGRPASFLSGGEVPIEVASGLGTNSIEFKEFGTRVDFVPIVLGNGNLRLEVRPMVSEVDASLGVNGTPGFRTRWVDTAVEMQAGQTLALAGLIQEKVEIEKRGLPYISDMPYIGAPFRRTRQRRNEVELLIVVTPELIGAIDPNDAPCALPGDHSGMPTTNELFWRGYMEKPASGPYDGMMHGQPGIGPMIQHGEEIPPGAPLIEVKRNGQASGDPDSQGVFTPSGPRDSREQPVSSRPRSSSQSGTSNSAPSSNSRLPAAPAPGTPGLIGPTGYDSLDF